MDSSAFLFKVKTKALFYHFHLELITIRDYIELDMALGGEWQPNQFIEKTLCISCLQEYGEMVQ